MVLTRILLSSFSSVMPLTALCLKQLACSLPTFILAMMQCVQEEQSNETLHKTYFLCPFCKLFVKIINPFSQYYFNMCVRASRTNLTSPCSSLYILLLCGCILLLFLIIAQNKISFFSVMRASETF